MFYTTGRLDGAPAPYFWCDSQHNVIYLVDPKQTVSLNAVPIRWVVYVMNSATHGNMHLNLADLSSKSPLQGRSSEILHDNLCGGLSLGKFHRKERWHHFGDSVMVCHQ